MDNTEPTVEAFDENGELIRKELAKESLSKGAWQTIMFLYQDRLSDGSFSEPKVSIRRFQKAQGMFRQKSKFNVSSKAQASAMIEVLRKWYEL